VTRRARIPRFPTFKRLELQDRTEVEALTAGFLPYSDFSFVSLWCWDTDGTCQFSRLNDNLVVKLKDYGTDEMFLSFLGTNAVAETAATLIAFAGRQGLSSDLRLVPDVVVTADQELQGTLSVTEDPGSFDYVLAVEDWVALSGGKFRNKRNAIRQFERRHAPEFRVVDLRSREVQQEIVRLFLLWSEMKKRFGLGETRNELLALRRAFGIGQDAGLISFGVYAHGVLCGFSINQELAGGYAIGHFWKADHSLPGIYAYMLHNTCRYLQERGLHLFNIEQDLGKSGLAYSKRLYRPDRLLKKYVVTDATGGAQAITPLEGRLSRRSAAAAPARAAGKPAVAVAR
jgi:hypothetical protein